jgi:hypothetical protein
MLAMSRAKHSQIGSGAVLVALSSVLLGGPLSAHAASNALPLEVVNGHGAVKADSFATTYNFGTTVHALQPTISHDFVFQNKTTSTVYLDRLLAGCSCSTLSLVGAGPDNTVAPGAKVTVKMDLDEKQLPESGLDKIAWLFVKGRTKPIVAMHMIGAVRPSLRYSPAIIEFGNISVEQTRTVPLTVSLDTRVYGTNPPDVAVEGGMLTAKRTGNQVDLGKKLIVRTYQVKLNPAGHLGRFDGAIYIPRPYNRGGGSVFVTGTVVGSIVSDPPAVAFRTVERGQTVTKQLILKGLTPTALAGLKIGSDTAGLTAKLATHGAKANTAVVDVSISPTTPGAMLANVLVSTKSGQTLKVLVSAWVN